MTDIQEYATNIDADIKKVEGRLAEIATEQKQLTADLKALKDARVALSGKRPAARKPAVKKDPETPNGMM